MHIDQGMVKKHVLILLLSLSLCFSCGCSTRAPSEAPPVTETSSSVAPTPAEIAETTIPITPVTTPSVSPEEYLRSTGGYYMNEWYNLSRVSKDEKTAIQVYITPYRYQFRDSYRYWDTVAAKYLPVDPPDDSRFLFVFVNVWMDDSAGNVYPIDGFDYTCFTLQDNGKLLQGSVDLHQIYEFQTYSNLFKSGYVVPFGYQWESNSITLKRQLKPLSRLEPGKGNSWDGFILYVVPKDTKPGDLKVVGNFEGLGSAYWIFQGGDRFSLD